jgi:uncharacterized protein
MNSQIEQEATAWYKQRWPWFIISFPLLTVVAGLVTYQIAVDKPHSLVKDDYFKQGLAINETLAKQNRAKELALTAHIKADKDSQLLSVKIASIDKEKKLPGFEMLNISFSHPTQEKNDRQLALLQLTSNEYIAELPTLPQAHWHIKLSDKSDTWEIKSRWHYPKSQQIKINAVDK